MKCPRCVQRIHATAAQCPHCGFSLSDLDEEFGREEVLLARLSDKAGALRLRERTKLHQWLVGFEKSFPQLFFSVYFGALQPNVSIRSFAFWLLNRGAFHDIDVTRPNEGGVMLVIDVAEKSATLTFGYQLDGFISDDVSFDILAAAHPFFLQEQYLAGCQVVLKKIVKHLRKQSRRLQLDSDHAGDLTEPQAMDQMLSRIRGHGKGSEGAGSRKEGDR